MTGKKGEQRSILRRPRLERRLDVGELRRLTMVTAGPGFGKTTLLSRAFDSRHAVWHTVTPADRSLSVLTRNVVRKLRLLVPDISADLVAAVEGGRGPDSGGDATRAVALAAALAQDLDAALLRDVVLVLDDVHEIQEGDESAAFVAALCRYVPRDLRVVTASRLPLPFPVSRLAVAGEVDGITAADLAFTVGEVESLIRESAGEVADGLADEIVTLTSGWPAAVVLAIQASASQAMPLQSVLAERTALFDYLAEEALALEGDADSAALRDLAVLPWVTPSLLESIGIEPDSTASLVSPGAPWMTEVPDVPNAVAVSPLTREFILQRHPVDSARRGSLLRGAARWYLEEDAYREALQCLIESGDTHELGIVLAEHGDSMIAAGMTRQVFEALQAIPRDEAGPDLLLTEAEVLQLLGDWEGAQARYRILVPDSGDIPPRLAWRLGFLYHMQGDVRAAIETYERGELGTDDHLAEAALLGWHGSAYWLRGERDEVKRLADMSLERARLSGDPRALAVAHTVLAMVAALDGDRALNDVHYIKALEHAEKGRDVVQTIRIRSNRGSHFLEEGGFDQALAELDIAFRLAEMTGFELWRAMALGNRGQVNIHRGLLEEALADLNEARATFRRMGSRLEAYPVKAIGDVHAVRGDTAQARAMYEEAIRLAEDQGDLQALVPAHAALARLTAPREPEEALGAAAASAKADFVIGRADALVAQGWAHLHAGHLQEARDLATDAADAARTRHDLPGLAEALELEAATVESDAALLLLDEARRIWESLGAPISLLRVEVLRAEQIGGPDGAALALDAAEELHRYGARALAQRARAFAEATAAGLVPVLAIKTLGGFDVKVSGASVPSSAWQSRVAREILWMLIAGRSRPINREVLLDRLWPDEDPAKSSNRLSVALTTIRKVLDPSREHEPDHYLVADREVVSLNTEHVSIDVEDFLHEARQGESLLRRGSDSEALDLLNRAEERYVGEFLEEQPYAEWAVGLREEARSAYMTVASILATTAEESRDYDLAARRYLRMLERDSFNEPAHIALVRVMDAAGRHGTARRLYGSYVEAMAELGVEPEPFPGSKGR